MGTRGNLETLLTTLLLLASTGLPRIQSNATPPPQFLMPPVVWMGPITGVYAGDKSVLLNSLLPQHARHRLRGIRLAKLIEKATSR